MTSPSFSLKDHLFNPTTVGQLADRIAAVDSEFERDEFCTAVLAQFPQLELKQRIAWIRECLRSFLPDDYQTAVQILLDALPPPCDPNLTDDDFGNFIYAPSGDFVAYYGRGCSDWDFSLNALRAITTRFSAEDAIRYFINTNPEKTFATLLEWTRDDHYHVRRLCSEGTRPKLPWSQKLVCAATSGLPILDILYTDKTRYVTRSVANHLNDISKVDADVVIDRLEAWRAKGGQRESELAYIARHGLRTLIKQGHPRALAYLGFHQDAPVAATVTIAQTTLQLGEPLEFECIVTTPTDMSVMIDYCIYFQNKSGQMTNKKIFKLSHGDQRAHTPTLYRKRHALRADMTTRTLYPGTHRLAVQVNGIVVAESDFVLV